MSFPENYTEHYIVIEQKQNSMDHEIKEKLHALSKKVNEKEFPIQNCGRLRCNKIAVIGDNLHWRTCQMNINRN